LTYLIFCSDGGLWGVVGFGLATLHFMARDSLLTLAYRPDFFPVACCPPGTIWG